MKVENDTPNRGAVMLAELKALVESFPHQQRTDVVQALKIVSKGLDADSKSRHSVHLQQEANTVLSSPFREAPASADLSNERHSENQKQKEGDER